MTIYTDASHRSTRLTLGVYNNRTGDAISLFAEPLQNVNNTRYAELLAIELGCSLFPNAVVINDNKGVLHWLQSKVWPTGFDGVCQRILGFDRSLRWVPREQNTIADWLASSPVEQRLKLPVGLADVELIPPFPRMPSKGIAPELKAQIAQYNQYLSGDAESLRTAEAWVLSWLLSDAKQKQELYQEKKELVREVKQLKIELTKVQSERSKLMRKFHKNA